MEKAFAPRLRRPEAFVVLIAGGVALVALAALTGWQTGSLLLTSVIGGAIALQPTTAIALLVGAGGLVAAAWGQRWLTWLAAFALLSACGAWLLAYATHHDLPVDLILFKKEVLAQRPLPRWPGRPSIITCVAVALYAASLSGVGVRHRGLKLAALGSASLGALIASLSILPFLVQDPSQLTVLHQSLRIALNTSVGVGALCAGVLVLKRDAGWVRLVGGGGEQGRIARLLIPVALVPILFGALANIGVRTGVYGPDVRMLLIIVLSAVALLFLAFWAAQTLGKQRVAHDSLASALERSTVIVVDSQGRISHWPKACEDLYGWTAAEALGRRPVDFLRVDGVATRDMIAAALEERGEWRGEVLHRTKDGGTRSIAIQWVRQEDAAAGERHAVGTINDITDLKLSDASLRESQERLTLAVEAYDLGIADADMSNRTIIADPGFERLLGVSPGGLDGSLDKLNAMVVAANPDRDLDIAARRPQQFDEVRMRRGDGEIRDFQGVRRFFYAPDGSHARTIGIYRDVTDERRVQAELALRGDHLAQLRSELAHVSRLSAMGEMAAALAHELNQPLTAIGNSAGAMKIMLGDGGQALDETTRARAVRAANHAEGQAVRAGEIVRRLRNFIARGEADARIEQLDRLIEDAVALAAPNAKSDGAEVRFDFSSGASRILADRIQIQQILVNLVRNAMEAMRGAPQPHLLTISTSEMDGMVEVSVRDTGPGVAADFAARLFLPFSSTKDDGMGVGLSICRRIVEAHGGRMWLENSDGAAGADFRFTIPLATEETQDA